MQSRGRDAGGRRDRPWPGAAGLDAPCRAARRSIRQGFVDCALAAARAALAEVEDARIVGLGVSGMAETGVLLGRDGEPVVPSIAWYDSRGEEAAERIKAEIPGFIATTGLSSRALRTVSKYRWLRDNVPESERGVRWLSVGEWVVHRLGGEQGAELSLASRTGWLDLHTRAWWDETLAWSDAPPGLLPEPAFAGTPLGRAGDALPARARRGAGRRRPRPPERRGRRRRGRRGRRARLVGHGRGVRARGGAARSRAGRAGGDRRDHGRLARGAGPPEPARRHALRRGARPRAGAAGRRARGPRRARARGARGRRRGDRADRAQRLPGRAGQHRRRPLPRRRMARGARVGRARRRATCSTRWRAWPVRTRGW